MRRRWAHGWAALAVLLGIATATWAAEAGRPVELPSLDAPGGSAVMLRGHWFAVPGAKTAPALVLMHGCGGAYERGQLALRYTELAARLNALGVHALVTDSFGPRGETQICTQKTGQRRITQLQRRRDALGALAWLAAQPGVDAQRLGLLGWSNGGSTVLAAVNARHAEVARAAMRPSLAVAFYPGCEAELQRGFEPVAPLLMLLGEKDDWTPPGPCKDLAAAARGPAPVQWEAFANAYHGFDGYAPLRHRRDVPNGAFPGQGVHVGAEPAARSAAAERLQRFLRESWKLEP